MNKSNTLSSHGILSHGILSISAQSLNSLVTYFSTLIIINTLGEHQYGIFSYTMVITGITSMIADFGMNPILLRMMSQTPERSKQIITEATVARLFLCIPTFIITNIVVLLQKQDTNFVLLINIMLLNMIFSAKMPIIRGTIESFFRSRARMSVPVILALLDSAILLVIALSARHLFATPLSAMIFFTGSNFIGCIVLVSWSLSILKKNTFSPWQIRIESIKGILIESLPLALFLFFNAVHSQFDSIYIDLFFTKKEVGIYNAALRLLIPLLYLPTMVGWAIVPFIARLNIQHDREAHDKIKLIYSIGIKSLLLISVFAAVIGYFESSLLVKVAFRGGYIDAISPLMIMFATYPFIAMNLYNVEINNVLGFQKRNMNTAIILMIVSALAGAIIIKPYGLVGAAMAKTTAILIGFLYLSFVIHKNIQWKYFYASINIILIAGISIAAAIFLSANNDLLRISLITLCFGGGIFFTRYFTPEELSLWQTQIALIFKRT